MTKTEAAALASTRWWEHASADEIARFQMNEPLLCCPFGVFHEAVEKVLGRPVFTHEFGLNYEGMKAELNGTQRPPTMEEIIALIPADKRVIKSETT